MSTLLVYSGLLAIVVGLISVIRPLRPLGLSTRMHGAAVIAGGLLLLIGAWSLPVREKIASGDTKLDQILPRYHFAEHHERRIDATPSQVWRALHEVKASDIRFFRTLTTIRRFGRPGPENILNAPDRLPILDVALNTSFVRLANDTNRELVVGTTVISPPGAATPQTAEAYRTITGRGFAVAAMNFRIEPDPGGGSLLTTDTRVYTTDNATRRRFGRYWSLIYPGSALIRREWLRAVEVRAQASRAPRAP